MEHRATQSFSSFDGLAALLSQFEEKPGVIVGIDGLPRVGKSTLARRLAAQLNHPAIEADLFIRDGALPYPQSLDGECLVRALDVARSQHSLVFLEAVLLLLVAEHHGLEVGMHVYYVASEREGDLRTEELFDSQSCERRLQEITETARIAGIEDDEPLLDREIAQYHLNQTPHSCCDVLYEEGGAEPLS